MPINRPPPRWLCLVFFLVGGYIILLALGVIPYYPRPGRRSIFADPQHWQVLSTGVCFVCGGIAIAFRGSRSFLLHINGAVMLVTLLAPIVWVFFFSENGFGNGWSLGLFVVMALIGGLSTWLRTRQGRSTGTEQSDDPLAAAQVYLHYGRVAQARELLIQAKARYPARAAEFQRLLDTL
ncbi:hypothetical protein [Chitinimonas sp.]|uniref:type IV pilus assembly protein FimV n=1 Tax=Chitinimonas sp. TaxID=1934313 RepID=UPI002F92A49C